MYGMQGESRMNWSWMKAVATGALALAVSGAFGCAEEREPINRVQPDAMAKSFFVGADLVDHSDNPEFYVNGTLLDIGYGAEVSGVFTAFYSNDLSIIRWEITEDLLIGRLAYERIEGTDGKGAGLETNDGQVLYVFNITRHFDIKNAYNSSTGEELNVIEENTSDRPWYQREYFRVDWSANKVTNAYDFDTMAVYGVLFGVDWEPINYYVNDPTHAHAPHFEPSDGYFDITNKAFATPGMVDLSSLGWGYTELPACWLDGDFAGGTAPNGNCNPVEVTIRHSFWKKPDSDYEPMDWDGFMFQAAGAFVKERYGFARNYGMSDTEWRRFISRYNIWDQSHVEQECYTPQTTPVGEDARRDIDPANGTHDECEAVGPGSRCDIYTQKCTIPYMSRETQPIVWYYTVDSDHRYFDATDLARHDWDAAMRVAVMAARQAECHRVGGIIEPNGVPVDCNLTFPAPHGQMTMMRDLVETLIEVDTCLKDRGTWDNQPCASTAAAELTERGYVEGTEDYIALYAAATMEHMVALCHSPIEAGDHPACATGKPRLPASITARMCDEARQEGGDKSIRSACDRAYNVRIGDVRRHLINVVKSPETPSPWGFGPTYSDPLTGQGISASINVWTAPTDMISQMTIDQVRFIAGELSVDDVTDGVYIKDYADAARLAGNQGALPPMRKDTLQQRIGGAVAATTRDLETGEGAGIKSAASGKVHPKVLAAIEQVGDLADVRADMHGHSVFGPTYRARMKQLEDTETEAALITPAMLQWSGSENLPIDMGIAMGSPVRGNFNPTLNRSHKHLKEQALAHRGACMLEADHFAPTPTAMLSLTKVLQEKFGAFNAADPVAVQLERAAKMKDWLANKMHYAVMIHEMGHTFGFRHNFVSSSGAFNYRPQYWQLRTRNGQVSQQCTDLTNSEDEAANCVGPRYYDQITQEETDQALWTWMHSSVMDYAGDYTQDMLGLGAYDFHAARMMYGETVTVFADADLNDGTDLSGALMQTIMDNFGGIVGYQYQSAPRGNFGSNRVHYTELQQLYNLISNCHPLPDVNVFKPSNWNEERDGVWSALFDGLIVEVDGVPSRCMQRRVAYMPWDTMRDSPLSSRAAGVVDPLGRTRVPYGFGTDRWADLGNLSVYRHDNGADPYELFNFFIAEQETRHIFDNYRRNRQTFSVRSASSRVLNRYNTKIRDGAKGMGLLKNIYDGIALDNDLDPADFFADVVDYWGFGDNMLASGVGFDHFARQLQRPNAGPHYDPGGLVSSTNTVLRWDDFEDAIVVVPDGAQGFWDSVGIGGKLVNNGLADGYGEYDANYTVNAGSYYDKVYAPMLMAESVDNFISDSLDDFVDPRYRAVSLADLFPDGYRRWLSNNLTGDDWIKAPRVAANGLTPDTLPDGYPVTPLGWISWWPETPELCFPASGSHVCAAYGVNGTTFEPLAPAATRAIDPQVGWEQIKQLIVMTLVYLPENQKQVWLDMMAIWDLGADSDPAFANRIEFHHPSGDIYVARGYGSEEICFESCKTVQRGIGARILEYANELLLQAYQTTPVTQNGVTWYVPDIDAATGTPIELTGSVALEARVQLDDYSSVPDFMRMALRDLKMYDDSIKGIYP